MFVTFATALYCTWGPTMVFVFLVPLPSGAVSVLEGVLIAVAPPAAGGLLWAQLGSYQAPESLRITENGVNGVIRFSPLKRFKPRIVEIPFDRVRRVYFFMPGWVVRSTVRSGGVWFIYLSRDNARRVKDAWDRWKALSSPFTAGA
jgi:hypothetical protein